MAGKIALLLILINYFTFYLTIRSTIGRTNFIFWCHKKYIDSSYRCLGFEKSLAYCGPRSPIRQQGPLVVGIHTLVGCEK